MVVVRGLVMQDALVVAILIAFLVVLILVGEHVIVSV